MSKEISILLIPPGQNIFGTRRDSGKTISWLESQNKSESRIEIAGQAVTFAKGGLDKIGLGVVGLSAGTPKLFVVDSVDGLRAAHERLAKLVKAGSGASIRVQQAGNGPSERSVKVTVSGVSKIIQVGPYEWGEDPDGQPSEHTITVPASMVQTKDGELYAPRWLLERTIRERIYKGQGLGARGGRRLVRARANLE